MRRIKTLPKRYRLKVYREARKELISYIEYYNNALDKPSFYNNGGIGLCSILKTAVLSTTNIRFDFYDYNYDNSKLLAYPELKNKFKGYMPFVNYWNCTYQDRLDYLDSAINKLSK